MVLKDLPKKCEVVIWTPLSRWQLDLYHEGMQVLNSSENAEFVGSLSYLRQVLNHPYHLLYAAPPAQSDGTQDRLVAASGKFEFLDRMMPRFIAFGHKILIFAQMTTLLDLLELLLARRGIRFERIDGSTVVKERRRAAEAFQNDRQVSVLLLTTRAGGVGLNLQAADTVILLDSDWNPQVDLQAMDRAHRIGQSHPVLVIRLASPVPLDRGLLLRASGKIDIEQKVIGGGRFSGKSVPEDQVGLVRQIVSEARQKDAGLGKEATNLEDLNRLLSRSCEELMAFKASDLALMGPPAATASGAPEALEARLERAGRLLAEDLGDLRRAACGAEATADQPPAFKRLCVGRNRK